MKQEGLNLLNIYGSAMNGGNPKTSVDAVNSVIAAAGRDGRPDEAIRILNEMGKYGVVPNERTYRSVVVACNQAEHEKRRQRQRQYRLKDSSILQSGRRDQPAFQDDDPINLQWWEAALSLFRRMKEEDLTPDIQTYSSVISACEAAGQWQRAIGVLRFMMSDDASQKPNKFCFNAAIAACEKGGAWLEAVELYERMRQQVKPNFITMNSLLIALENADQKEMAENMYREALKDKTVRPWKLTLHENSKRIYAMVSSIRFIPRDNPF
jgi:pentatricopeptide repeat domain-containing protein 1